MTDDRRKEIEENWNIEDCIREIAKLEKERDFFKKTLAINHLLDQKGAEILGKMVATAGEKLAPFSEEQTARADERLCEIASRMEIHNGVTDDELAQVEIEAANILAASGRKTICADCGKPSGDRHNCPEQAAANRKARAKR